MTVPSWPKRPGVVGLGVSNWSGFAKFLSKKLRYIDAQFDRQLYPSHPFLDITQPTANYLNIADFVICSEVLEHVPPPVEAAFSGLYRLLKPGGLLIFTVPYGFEPTVEHFPDLHDWQLHDRSGTRVLINRTKSGTWEEFSDLCFHGGGASVLEMRIFGLDDLKSHLARAGFVDVEVMERDILTYGIRSVEPWGRPITARRPRD